MGTRKHTVFCDVLSEVPSDSTRSTFWIHAETNERLLELDQHFVFFQLIVYLSTFSSTSKPPCPPTMNRKQFENHLKCPHL